MYKILLVEDDYALCSSMKEWLERYNFVVEDVENFKNLEQQFDNSKPHLVILDVNLPYLDGFYFVKAFRKKSSTPIIIVSARNSSAEQVMGMELGADDYITKPFVMEVLLAKINAVLRRSVAACQMETAILRVGRLELDTQKLTAYNGNKQTLLSKNEFMLLKLLIEKSGELVRREELFEALWDDISFVEENTLSVNIARLKARLDEIGFVDTIKVKRGMGYYLDTERL